MPKSSQPLLVAGEEGERRDPSVSVCREHIGQYFSGRRKRQRSDLLRMITDPKQSLQYLFQGSATDPARQRRVRRSRHCRRRPEIAHRRPHSCQTNSSSSPSLQLQIVVATPSHLYPQFSRTGIGPSAGWVRVQVKPNMLEKSPTSRVLTSASMSAESSTINGRLDHDRGPELVFAYWSHTNKDFGFVFAYTLVVIRLHSRFFQYFEEHFFISF